MLQDIWIDNLLFNITQPLFLHLLPVATRAALPRKTHQRTFQEASRGQDSPNPTRNALRQIEGDWQTKLSHHLNENTELSSTSGNSLEARLEAYLCRLTAHSACTVCVFEDVIAAIQACVRVCSITNAQGTLFDSCTTTRHCTGRLLHSHCTFRKSSVVQPRFAECAAAMCCDVHHDTSRTLWIHCLYHAQLTTYSCSLMLILSYCSPK